MKSLLPWTRAYKARKLAEESDFGRRYGWFIEMHGERIGELEYIRWDSYLQFWHEYFVTWYKETDSCIEADPDAWCEKKVVLRNKKFQDVLISDFITAPRVKGVIAVRAAFVPVERFRGEMEKRRVITNTTDHLMLVFTELEAQDYWLKPGESVELRAEVKSETDDFVIEETEEGVTVWPSIGMADIATFSKNEELFCGHQRPKGWA